MPHQGKLAAIILTSVLMATGAIAPRTLAQAPRPTRPVAFSVKDFGALGDGKTLDTRAIAKAIKAANAAGGGTVFFPAGVYVAGTFELLSNVTLDLDAGAVIQGSKNLADYASIADYGLGRIYGVNSSGEGLKVGLIVARNARNIAIVGRGSINGSGDDFFDFTTRHVGADFDARYTRQGNDFMSLKFGNEDGPVEAKPAGRPGTMIIFSDCQNVLIRDVTLRNAPNWTLHLARCEDAVISGIHIVNNLLIPNNDGVDCIGSHDVHFSDCDIRAGDDDFAIVGSENVTVVNCALVSQSSGIRLEDTRYSTFENLAIHANRGIAIYERGGGTTAHVLFSGVAIETRLLTGHWWGKAEPIYIATAAGDGRSGEVRDVQFSHITAEAESGILLYGSKGTVIRNVSFDRIKLKVRAPREKASESVGGNFDLRWTATGLANAVFKHDTPALYCSEIDGLRVHGFEVEWGEHLPAYFSHGIECEDFRDLELDGFEGRQAFAPSPLAAIELRRGRGVSVRNSKAGEGTGTFLSVTALTDQRLFVNNDVANARRVFEGGKPAFRVFGNNLLPQRNAVPAAKKSEKH